MSAGRVVGGDVGILLAENLGRSGVLNVVKPALDGDFAAGDAEIAEGQHGGVGRRSVPQVERDFGGLAGHLQGIKALGDEFDYAGIIQVVPERVVEGFEQSGVLRVGVGGL